MKYETAIYGRTSNDDRRKVTIELQQTTLRTWSGTDPFVSSIAGEYWDSDVTGKIPLWDRPAGRRLLADIDAGKVKSVAIVFIDRLGRTTLDSLQAAAKLEEKGVKLVAVNDGWDARRNDDPLYFQIRAAIAEAEWRRIKARTEDGRRRAAERDNAPPGGSLVFGYRMGPNGQFIIDPIEAEIVRGIFRMAAEGKPFSAIVAWVQSTGVPAGRRWQKRTPGAEVRIASHHAGAQWRIPRIGFILRQRAYIGERTYGGRVYPVPSIIDPDTWDRVQEICSRYVRWRNHDQQKGLLSGLLKCARCKTAFHYQSNKHWKPWYVCVGRRRMGCDGPRIAVPPIDRVVWELVREYIEDPQRIIREAVASRGKAEETLADLEKEETRIQTALSAIETEVKAVWEEQAKHDWPFAWVAPRLDALNDRRSKLAAEQAAIRSRRAAVRLDAENVERIAAETIRIMDDSLFSTPARKAELVRQHITEIEVRSATEGVIHFAWGGKPRVLKFPRTCNTELVEAVLRLPFEIPTE